MDIINYFLGLGAAYIAVILVMFALSVWIMAKMGILQWIIGIALVLYFGAHYLIFQSLF